MGWWKPTNSPKFWGEEFFCKGFLTWYKPWAETREKTKLKNTWTWIFRSCVCKICVKIYQQNLPILGGRNFFKDPGICWKFVFFRGGWCDDANALLLFPEILVFLATTPGVKLGVASFGRHWQTRYKVGPLVTSYNWVEITPMVLGWNKNSEPFIRPFIGFIGVISPFITAVRDPPCKADSFYTPWS